MNLFSSQKFQYIVYLICLSLGLYVVFRFLLPLFLPFVLAYLIAVLIHPLVIKIEHATPLNKTCSTLLVLLVVLGVIGFAGGWICVKLCEQIFYFISHWSDYEPEILNRLGNICCSIEKNFHLPNGCISDFMTDGIDSFLNTAKSRTMPVVMHTSIPTFVAFLEIFATIVITGIATFLFTKDMDRLRIRKRNHLFADEIALICGKLRLVFTAYLKAQSIIMLFTVLICFIALSLIHHPYALLISIVIGLLDALPLIGCGIFLIPWVIISLISKEFMKAALLFAAFILCYLVREYIEPKIVGNSTGIHPLESLIALFVGYQLFGLIGFILGPIGYILLKEILRQHVSE